jgi:hypothetical protein
MNVHFLFHGHLNYNFPRIYHYSKIIKIIKFIFFKKKLKLQIIPL